MDTVGTPAVMSVTDSRLVGGVLLHKNSINYVHCCVANLPYAPSLEHACRSISFLLLVSPFLAKIWKHKRGDASHNGEDELFRSLD